MRSNVSRHTCKSSNLSCHTCTWLNLSRHKRKWSKVPHHACKWSNASHHMCITSHVITIERVYQRFQVVLRNTIWRLNDFAGVKNHFVLKNHFFHDTHDFTSPFSEIWRFIDFAGATNHFFSWSKRFYFVIFRWWFHCMFSASLSGSKST